MIGKRKCNPEAMYTQKKKKQKVSNFDKIIENRVFARKQQVFESDIARSLKEFWFLQKIARPADVDPEIVLREAGVPRNEIGRWKAFYIPSEFGHNSYMTPSKQKISKVRDGPTESTEVESPLESPLLIPKKVKTTAAPTFEELSKFINDVSVEADFYHSTELLAREMIEKYSEKKKVKIEKLPLLAVTALFIANKYEEAYFLSINCLT